MPSLPSILTINSGSSSLKACLFQADGTRQHFHYGALRDPRSGFEQLLDELAGAAPDMVGHRFVHGGDIRDAARRVDAAERERLQSLVPLAPLHLPGNLLGLELCSRRFAVPQIACFDTAFHATLPQLASRLPLPQELGLRRYGFHGLNYAHIASQLPALLGAAAHGRIIAAHLGHGASLCLLEKLQSVDTSMGYTPAGGITMGTRSGDLDPGVMLALAERYEHAALSELVYKHMGLLALSGGESSEMSALLQSRSPQAAFAVAYFCRQVRAGIGSLAAKAGGVDALVFSGGIGEHAAAIRAEICAPLGFLGFALDNAANRACATRIEQRQHKPVLVIAADEEATIRQLCLASAPQH